MVTTIFIDDYDDDNYSMASSSYNFYDWWQDEKERKKERKKIKRKEKRRKAEAIRV